MINRLATGVLLAGCMLAGPTHAQNPEKFEHVTPSKRPPSPANVKPRAPAPEPAPTRSTDPAAMTTELVRKGRAKEAEQGFCANTNWPDVGDWVEALKHASVGKAGPFTGLYNGRVPILFRGTHEGHPICGMVRADPNPASPGKECVVVNMVICQQNVRCNANAVPGCKDRHGYWQLRP